MASSTATKKTFVVWAPDYDAPDVLTRRLAVRPNHLENVRGLAANGFIKIGGPLSDAETEKFNGSLFVVEAESVAAVREVLEKDPYWINNVWDKEKVDIRLVTISVNSH
ncbi:hypothetical protein BJV74DRAFT_776587 [Russula compacta]|nr:hypothetical protein BJV74DRAFT_776587 [Russula compacta]